MGGVDQQHIVQTPTGLITFWPLGGLLSPAEAHAISFGVLWQWKQVDDSAAVGGGPGGDHMFQGLRQIVMEVG